MANTYLALRVISLLGRNEEFSSSKVREGFDWCLPARGAFFLRRYHGNTVTVCACVCVCGGGCNSACHQWPTAPSPAAGCQETRQTHPPLHESQVHVSQTAKEDRNEELVQAFRDKRRLRRASNSVSTIAASTWKTGLAISISIVACEEGKEPEMFP